MDNTDIRYYTTERHASDEGGFPKVIHIIYNFWSDKTPKEIQRRIDKWAQVHPDYKITRWNKKNSRLFIKKEYEWFLPIYDGYKYAIQRCDALRYFILY